MIRAMYLLTLAAFLSMVINVSPVRAADPDEKVIEGKTQTVKMKIKKSGTYTAKGKTETHKLKICDAKGKNCNTTTFKHTPETIFDVELKDDPDGKTTKTETVLTEWPKDPLKVQVTNWPDNAGLFEKKDKGWPEWAYWLAAIGSLLGATGIACGIAYGTGGFTSNTNTGTITVTNTGPHTN